MGLLIMNLMDSIDKIFFKPNLVTVNNSQFEEEFVTHVKDEVKKPKFYKVLLHNDDYTTMEFVLHVLKKIFGKSHEEAERIMFKVHYEGVGVCGVYTFEVAETKVSQVQREANENGHPLQCSYEEE